MRTAGPAVDEPSRGAAPARPPRWESLDDLRGAAVLLMVPVNVAAPFASIPGWFKHAPGAGFTVADVVVPLFLCALGISSGFSWRRRVARDGWGRAFLHALLRNALLAAFGVAGILLADPGDRWGVLVMLGATGLVSFFFLGIPAWPRIGAAFALLAAVEALRPFGLGSLLSAWYDTGLGGPWGTPSLSFFAILASAGGELLLPLAPRRRLAALAAAAAVLATLGAAALPLGPLSKHAVTASWVLTSGAAAAAGLGLLVLLREIGGLHVPLLGSLGRNPLLLYGVHAVLGLAALALLGGTAAAPAAWAAALVVLALCTALAALLDRRRLYVKL